MAQDERLARRFEEHRPHLTAVAYRMLGSSSDAEDAVQNAWLRLGGADAGAIEDLRRWLTTVVCRECLHTLRSRRRRREELLDTTPGRLPDPVVTAADDVGDPERTALLAESVSLALLVVLDALGPAERVAFVLHDMFGLPFEEIAPMVGRTPAAARQLASRARRRVRGSQPVGPDASGPEQRRVVDAFLQAAHDGDVAALAGLLAPDVVLHADYGPGRPPAVHRGAATVARQSLAARGADVRPVLVNGLPGVVASRGGHPQSLLAFTVVGGRIAAIHGIRDPERLGRVLAGWPVTGPPVDAGALRSPGGAGSSSPSAS